MLCSVAMATCLLRLRLCAIYSLGGRFCPLNATILAYCWKPWLGGGLTQVMTLPKVIVFRAHRQKLPFACLISCQQKPCVLLSTAEDSRSSLSTGLQEGAGKKKRSLEEREGSHKDMSDRNRLPRGSWC